MEDIDAEKPQGGLGSRIWVRFGRISGFAGFGGSECIINLGA